MSLKKFIPCIAVAFLAACSDDSSDFLTRPSGGSSSSVESSSSEAESSSSSSKKNGDAGTESGMTSSSSKKSSSSSVTPKSSSSETSVSSSAKSSSSEGSSDSKSSSSSPKIVNLSSSAYKPYDHSQDLADGLNYKLSDYKTFVDPRNGRSYYYYTATSNRTGKSITVMAENLNIGEMVLGENDQNDDSKIERYCYNNDTTRCDIYGGLYQWAEMMQLPSRCNTESCSELIQENHRGICPEGWRLFTWDDYVVIRQYKDDFDWGIAGLRAKSFIGYNTSGFSLIGGGRRSPEGRFDHLNETIYWSYPQEHEYDIAEYAYAAYVSKNSNDGTGTSSDRRAEKKSGRSVRCTKLVTETVPSSSSEASSSSVESSSSEYVPYDHQTDLFADSLNSGAYKKFTDVRNGRSYYYLTINGEKIGGEKGSVTVMAENLNIGIDVPGTEDQSDDENIERYCYNDDTTNCDKYGGLYQWAEMMQLPSRCNVDACDDLIEENHRGICPEGWHVLTYDEYVIVLTANKEEKNIRAISFGGDNLTGYSLIGAGHNRNYQFADLDNMTFWFYPENGTMSEPSAFSGYQLKSSAGMDFTSSRKSYANSVRCVKD